MCNLKNENYIFGFFLALIGATLCLYSAELVLRWFMVLLPIPGCYSRAMTPGMTIPFKQREFDLVVKYNRYGFRGAEFPIVKKQGELRVLLLGDSMIEGQGVAEDRRVSDVLQKKLDKEAMFQKCAVINGAQIATNPDEYYRNLNALVLL